MFIPEIASSGKSGHVFPMTQYGFSVPLSFDQRTRAAFSSSDVTTCDIGPDAYVAVATNARSAHVTTARRELVAARKMMGATMIAMSRASVSLRRRASIWSPSVPDHEMT